MNKLQVRNWNISVIVFCLAAILLIYSVDLHRLAGRLTSWKALGELTVAPTRIHYFVSDTPNLISYEEKETGEYITCAQAIAYVETEDAQMVRCCQAKDKNSCATGDFSAEIPDIDPACTDLLRATFGIPTSVPGAQASLIHGSCPEGGNPELTITQIDTNGKILWKTLTVFELALVNSALRCILSPLLFFLAVRTFMIMRKKPDPEREMRKW